MLNVIIADDHGIVRQGIKSIFANNEDIKIIAEAENGNDAIEKTEKLKPNILIMDISMPGVNGLDAIKEVKARSPKTKIIIFSMYDDEAYIAKALRNGADGYFIKDDNTALLPSAVKEVFGGEIYLSPSVSHKIIKSYIDDSPSISKSTPAIETKISTREAQILCLVAEGLTSTTIASQLTISPRTVETHRANMMKKLGLKNQAELVKFAVNNGYVRRAKFG